MTRRARTEGELALWRWADGRGTPRADALGALARRLRRHPRYVQAVLLHGGASQLLGERLGRELRCDEDNFCVARRLTPSGGPGERDRPCQRDRFDGDSFDQADSDGDSEADSSATPTPKGGTEGAGTP